MITKIQPKLYNYYNFKPNYLTKSDNRLNNNNITFAGFGSNIPTSPYLFSDTPKYDNIAADVEARAIKLAKKYKHKEVNHWHIMSIAFSDILDFIDKYEKKQVDLNDMVDGDAPSYFVNIYNKEIFENEEYRNQFKKIIKEEQKNVDSVLNKFPKKETKTIKMADSFYNDIHSFLLLPLRTDHWILLSQMGFCI